MTTELDLSGVAQSRSQTHEALQATVTAARNERDELGRVADDVAARIAELDALLESLDTDGQQPTEKRRTARPSSQRPAGTQADSGTNGHRVSDVAEAVLQSSARALTFDALAGRVSEEVGGDIDRRGLAGALNGGKRSGRFAQTKAGRWKATARPAASDDD